MAVDYYQVWQGSIGVTMSLQVRPVIPMAKPLHRSEVKSIGQTM